MNSEIPPTRNTLNSPRVALVCMPWGSVLKPPVGLAILKRSAQMAGFIPQVHFLNMKFAERMGLETYERISEEGFLWAEWFFSQAAFGPNGSGQLKNDWSSIKGDPDASDLVEALGKVTDDPGGLSSRIAGEYIPAFLDECLTEIAWSEYSVIGFTTTFAQSLSSLLLARLIKERWPELKVVFGGANVDSEMGVEYLRNFPWIDYVAHGEAENTFPELLNNIAAGCPDRRISGISMRCDGEVVVGCQESRPLVNMNDSPLPDYSDYLRELEKRKWKKPNFRLYFESSRGCWWGAKHHCTFCGLNGGTMAFRRKNSDRVRQEIRQLAQDYRCLNFAATDNILPMDYVEHLMPQLEDMDLDFDLFYEVKANLGRKHLRALAGAGVQSIQPGIESFNTAVLNLMRKGVSAIQNVQLLKWCREYNIEPLYNIIFGSPGESEESYRDTPQLMRALSHLRPPQSIHELMFQRFSPYDFDRDALKIRLTPLPIYRHIFPQEGASLERMAYYFKGDWEGRKQDVSYIRPVIDAWRAWEKRWSAQDAFCYYEKGPAFLSIYDNRPLNADGRARCRRIVLSEHASALYLFCDENRSLGSILSMMDEKFAGASLEQNVMLWLDQLVKQGLMMREGDRYLSLAVRKAGKTRMTQPAPAKRPRMPEKEDRVFPVSAENGPLVRIASHS